MHTATTLPRPPGPSSKAWGLNHLQSMRQDYLGFVEDLHKRHLDIAHVRILNERITHVFHPDWVRQIMVEQADSLIRWERATDVFRISMGQSILVTEGDAWQRQRRMLQPGFTPKRVAGYAGLMREAMQLALGSLASKTGSVTVDVEALMTQTTLDIILRTLFRRPAGLDTPVIAQAIQTLSQFGFSQLFRPFTWPLWMPFASVRRARQALQTLDQLIDRHIHAHASPANSDHDDLLSMLLQTRDPEKPDQGLSAQELHDQAMVIFQAGHETTATAMTWWCGLIAQHPDAARHIQAEIDAVLNENDLTPEALAHMPWLQASLKEALRLYPPAAILFTRRACRDISVGPWTIPRGELVAFTPYVIQRDARWFERPNEFLPERFLPGAAEVPRGAWLPFGTGPRVCIGQHFALLEMAIVAAMLLKRFDLEWPHDQSWPESRLAISLRPANPMRLQLRVRDAAVG